MDFPGTNSNAPALSLLMAIWWEEGEDCARRARRSDKEI